MPHVDELQEGLGRLRGAVLDDGDSPIGLRRAGVGQHGAEDFRPGRQHESAAGKVLPVADQGEVVQVLVALGCSDGIQHSTTAFRQSGFKVYTYTILLNYVSYTVLDLNSGLEIVCAC